MHKTFLKNELEKLKNSTGLEFVPGALIPNILHSHSIILNDLECS